VSGYKVSRSLNSSGPFSEIGTIASPSYPDSGLSASTTYYYVVAAYDAANNMSGDSNVASATTQTAPVTSSLSVSLSASPTGGKSPVTVSFVATPSGATSVIYDWNFGDGGFLSGTSSSSVRNTYGKGNYTVTVKGTDASTGASAQASTTIKVVGRPGAVATSSGSTTTALSVSEGQLYQFTAVEVDDSNRAVALAPELLALAELNVDQVARGKGQVDAFLEEGKSYQICESFPSDNTTPDCWAVQQNHGMLQLISGNPTTFIINSTEASQSSSTGDMYSVSSGGCGKADGGSYLWLLLAGLAIVFMRRTPKHEIFSTGKKSLQSWPPLN